MIKVKVTSSETPCIGMHCTACIYCRYAKNPSRIIQFLLKCYFLWFNIQICWKWNDEQYIIRDLSATVARLAVFLGKVYEIEPTYFVIRLQLPTFYFSVSLSLTHSWGGKTHRLTHSLALNPKALKRREWHLTIYLINDSFAGAQCPTIEVHKDCAMRSGYTHTLFDIKNRFFNCSDIIFVTLKNHSLFLLLTAYVCLRNKNECDTFALELTYLINDSFAGAQCKTIEVHKNCAMSSGYKHTLFNIKNRFFNCSDIIFVTLKNHNLFLLLTDYVCLRNKGKCDIFPPELIHKKHQLFGLLTWPIYSTNEYRGFRKYRIRKYRIFGSNGHFGNPQIDIFH